MIVTLITLAVFAATYWLAVLFGARNPSQLAVVVWAIFNVLAVIGLLLKRKRQGSSFPK